MNPSSCPDIMGKESFFSLLYFSSRRLTILIVCVIMHSSTCSAVASSNWIDDRTDVMGRYTFANRKQCQRLCWYRKLCAYYSFHSAEETGVNCLLHTKSLQVFALPAEWSLESLPKNGVLNACSSRPCSEAEVCVPDRILSSQYRCLPLPADCGAPAVDNGMLQWQGTQQGHSATLLCNPKFLPTPASKTQLTCAVTFRWIPMDMTCEPICFNNGTNSAGKCLCPVQYCGTHCERYARDCTEIYNNDLKLEGQKGVFFIQPVTAPQPFKVYCLFQYGGVTYVMRWQALFPIKDMTWTTAREGLTRADLQQKPDSDFFVGLENLHHLSSQAFYFVHVSLWGGVRGDGTMYDRFTVGPENSSYSLTYDRAYPREGGSGGDGFSQTGPILFSASGRDVNGCAERRGAPGWYGPGCEGFSLFVDGDLIWPSNGKNGSFDKVELMLTREDIFYFDQN